MSLSAVELEELVAKLLENGALPGTVARTFDLDLELVKEAQSRLRITNYGTDDVTEYLDQIQWDTLQEVQSIMARGTVADKIRFASIILGKQVALNARRKPETERVRTDALLDALTNMREGAPERPTEKSKFISVAEGNENDE